MFGAVLLAVTSSSFCVAAQVELEVAQSLLEEAKVRALSPSLCSTLTLLHLLQVHLAEVERHHAASPALLTAKGLLALKTRRVADAVDSLLASQTLRPIDFPTTLALGRAYLASKQTAQAIPTLLQAARLHPSSSDVFATLGLAFVDTDAKRAEQCFRKAVTLDPSDEQAGAACWQLLVEQGRASEANALVRAVSQASGVERVKWVWLRLGLLALSEMDASTAIAALQKALRNARNNARVWYSLGQSYLQRGSYASALKALGRSFEIDPSMVEAKCLFAQVQRQLGQVAEAVATYQACLSVEKNFPPAVEGLLLARLDACREALGRGLQGPAAEHIAQGVALFLRQVARCGGYVCLWKHAGDLLNAAFHLDASHAASMEATMARLRCFCGLDLNVPLAAVTVHVYAEHVRRAESSGAWYDLALAQYRQALHHDGNAGGLQAAFDGVQQSLRMDSNNAESWELLGTVATELKVCLSLMDVF
jgi:tetratricopeptide (TPR) repeat protein